MMWLCITKLLFTFFPDSKNRSWNAFLLESVLLGKRSSWKGFLLERFPLGKGSSWKGFLLESVPLGKRSTWKAFLFESVPLWKRSSCKAFFLEMMGSLSRSPTLILISPKAWVKVQEKQTELLKRKLLDTKYSAFLKLIRNFMAPTGELNLWC